MTTGEGKCELLLIWMCDARVPLHLQAAVLLCCHLPVEQQDLHLHDVQYGLRGSAAVMEGGQKRKSLIIP